MVVFPEGSAEESGGAEVCFYGEKAQYEDGYPQCEIRDVIEYGIVFFLASLFAFGFCHRE